MVKQINLPAHTLSDDIVQTGISAIRAFSEDQKVPAYISGGMAVQTYLPEHLRRSSVDLDFNSLLCGNNGQTYQEATNALTKFLLNSGHIVSFKQRDTTFDYTVKKDEETLLVQHPKRSPNNFARSLDNFKREADNSRTFTYRDGQFKAISPEDIIAKKSNRVMRFICQYGLDFPTAKPILERKLQADAQRTNILNHIGDESPEKLGKDIAELRVNYDCFDIQALGDTVPLDHDYLRNTMNGWQAKFDRKDYQLFFRLLGLDSIVKDLE